MRDSPIEGSAFPGARSVVCRPDVAGHGQRSPEPWRNTNWALGLRRFGAILGVMAAALWGGDLCQAQTICQNAQRLIAVPSWTATFNVQGTGSGDVSGIHYTGQQSVSGSASLNSPVPYTNPIPFGYWSRAGGQVLQYYILAFLGFMGT